MTGEIESVVLVRHARSLGNVDPTIYQTMPDHAVPLCAPDDDPDASQAGNLLGKLGLDPSRVCSWSSTYLRCRQTEDIVMRRAFGDASSQIRRRESFLLREQEYGDWDGLSDAQIQVRDPERWRKRQRLIEEFGRFYFRYPNGESRADVVQRIAIFIGKVHRSGYRHHLLFVHGVTQRAFRMAWFDRSVEWFEQEPNPKNASVLIVERDPVSRRWLERVLEPKESTA